MFLYFFYCLKFFTFLPNNISRYGPWERYHNPWARESTAAHCCFVWICQGCVWLFCTTFPTNTQDNLHRTIYPQWSHRCCPQPANIKWMSLSSFIDGLTHPSLGHWNPNRRRRKRTARPRGHPQELIQTVAATTHADARNFNGLHSIQSCSTCG